MRVTPDLPEELVRQVREYAALENRTLKYVFEDLLRRGLASVEGTQRVRHRAKFPLIDGGHPAPPGQELASERIKDILLEEDVKHYFESIGQTPPSPSYD
jgi:hypothetical protein